MNIANTVFIVANLNFNKLKFIKTLFHSQLQLINCTNEVSHSINIFFI